MKKEQTQKEQTPNPHGVKTVNQKSQVQKVAAVELANIYCKKLKYIIIGEGDDKVVISVGDKTFDNVKSLTE